MLQLAPLKLKFSRLRTPLTSVSWIYTPALLRILRYFDEDSISRRPIFMPFDLSTIYRLWLRISSARDSNLSLVSVGT